MAEPTKMATLSVNDILDGIIDGLQASKNIVVNVASGSVDLGQDVVEGANAKFDELIDALQKLKG